MTQHKLLLSAGSRQFRDLSTNDFLWRPHSEQRSSMLTPLSPSLEELGPVPPLHVDFVRLAALVFLADRSARRGQGPGVRWDRQLELTVPVSDRDIWTSARASLEQHLHLLTGDAWSLTFERQRAPKKQQIADVEPAPVVCLFSGGADSLAGVLRAHAEYGKPPVLASHWDFNATSNAQSTLVSKLEAHWGERFDHQRIRFQRRQNQVGSGDSFSDEKSRRSRSLLFIALGLAVAAVRDADLLMSENGFTSINPPLSPERRGSLSTRTTHPAFLDGLIATLTDLGLSARLRNPLEDETKGQVLKDAILGLDRRFAEDIFSASHSCGKPPWFRGYRQSEQCGLCYGCLVRRGAFISAGISDSTLYIEEDLRGRGRRDDFATPTRMKTVQAVRYRLGRGGFSTADIIGMGLPDRMSVTRSLALVQAGMEELRPVVAGIP